MVQTFSWTHFNKPININGGKCDWRGRKEEGTAEKISSSIYNKASPRPALRPLTSNPFAKTFVYENRKENSTYLLYLVHVKEHIINYNNIYNMIYPHAA